MEEHISKYNECSYLKKRCNQEGKKVYMKYGKIIFNNRVED